MFTAWIAWACLWSLSHGMVIEKVFRDPFEHPLERMIIHKHTGDLYVGATNNLFKLSPELTLLENAYTGPADDNPMCPPPLIPCQEKKVMTNSHNQGLVIDYKRKSIVVCLTLFHGACHVRKLSNITIVDGALSKPVVSNHKNSSSVVVTAPGLDGDAIYVASPYSNHGNKRYRDLVPSISSRDLETLEFTYRDTSGGSKIAVLPKYRTKHFVNPVYGFSHGDFIYFITTQHESEDTNSPYITKIIRLCHLDKRFESYVEVPLECHGRLQYNLAQAAYLFTKSGKLYVTYAKGKPHMNIPMRETAVCVFTIKDIDAKIEENIQECHNGIGNTGPVYLRESVPCVKKETPLELCGKDFDSHPSIDGKKPITAKPILEKSGVYFTAITAMNIRNLSLIFLGTSTGYVYKVIVRENNQSQILEELPMDPGRPILKEMFFSRNHQYLYSMSEEKVTMIDFQDCNSKKSCKECVADSDPLCGWCVMERRCTRKDKCPASKVHPHWVSATSGTCLKMIDVLPDKLSLENIKSDKGFDQVQFKVDKVKLPSSLDNIGCVFSSDNALEETQASIQQDVIICPLPNHKNLPEIPNGEDNTDMNVEFRVDGQAIVKRSVKIFDCKVHTTCTKCTSSEFSCQWCPSTGTCVDSSSSSCTDTNNAKSTPQSDIRNPDNCPRLVNPSSDIVVHSGEKKQVKVTVLNLEPDQKQGLKCHFSLLGKKKTVTAKVTNDDLICQTTEFTYADKEIPYVTSSFQVTWGSKNLQLDNPDNIKVRVYKCPLMVTNCGKCLSMDEEYDCVWCTGTCTLSKKCTGKFLKRSDTCPNPRILRFSPGTGPIGGKTVISVTGINLGKRIKDLSGEVTVAGVDCKVLSTDYQTSSGFDCETDVQKSPAHGTIQINVAGKYPAESDGIFEFVNPSLKDITPSKGPKSGGTLVIVHGEHMNTGSMWNVTVGNNPCAIVRQNASIIECITAAEGAVTSADVQVNFGGLLKKLDKKFEFEEDPTITMVEPKRTILSGGTTLTVTGTNLDLIQEPKLFIKYNNTTKEATCLPKQQNSLECIVPAVDFGDEPISVTSPKEVQYGFIMDGVSQLKNLSDSPQFRPLLYFPDPIVRPFSEEKNTKKYVKGDRLVIEGQFRSINQLMTDVYIHVGSSLCTDPMPHDTALMCTPPTSPSGIDKEGNAPVVLSIGKYQCDIGYLSYYEMQEGERPIALGIILGVALPMLTIIILLTVCVVRRHMKHAPSDNYIPDVLKDYEGKKEEEAIGMNHMPSETIDSTQYISELVSGVTDEQERQQISQLLITRSKLDVGELVGKGNFGVTYKAQYVKVDSEPPLTVAVKSLQGTNTDKKALLKYLKNGLVLKELQHNHIIPILAVCLSVSDDPVVVVPYMDTPDLRTHIRDSSKSLAVSTLLDYGQQIADGMAYLVELKVIHHNLAARNCLLCEGKTVKVTDIGLTQELFSKDYYFTEEHTAKLPVKWMAPESLENFVFSIQSDVWSYGVVLWELMTRGVTPYPDVVPWDVHSYLQSGRRMQKPKYCPEFIYQLMLKCWQLEPDDRPSFTEILASLDKVSQNEIGAEGEGQPLNTNVEFTGSTEYLEVIE